jgi:uncharacterized protein
MSPRYHPRVIDKELDLLQKQLPAISLEGAKGVGKTKTASQRARTIHQLDDPAAQELLRNAPYTLLEGKPPILIDEWQLFPSSWDLVRRDVDKEASPGKFILTGSASLRDPSTHSGAGRIDRLRMRPLSLFERLRPEKTVSLNDLLQNKPLSEQLTTEWTIENYVDEIVRSGFPGFRDLSGRALVTRINGYIERVIDKDFADMGRQVRKPETLRNWMRAYAASISTITSYEKIRDAATGGHHDKPSRKATAPYIDTLSRLWILDPVDAWQPSLSRLTRLSESPKHHLVDPALAVSLLGIDKRALLNNPHAGSPYIRDGKLLGNLFESLITQSVKVYAQASAARVLHFRNYDGTQEADLIIERPDGKVIAIEIKSYPDIDSDDVKHLNKLEDIIGENLIQKVVINSGKLAYRRNDGIVVIPGSLLGP